METAGQKQPLLVPYIIRTESIDDDKYIDSIKEELMKALHLKASNVVIVSLM